ncbi:MAG: hypothetical protein LBV52_01825 [Spirochaetaceae bacterium]|jgi:hypothetical protein|nr:hypothetical protein [Spirochaetaceae bacterium]
MIFNFRDEMKRFTLIISLIFLQTAFIFADMGGQIELSSGAHFYRDQNSLLDGSLVTTSDFSACVGISSVFFFGRIGFGEYCTLFFPIQRSSTDQPVMGYGDYQYAIGVDDLLGISLKLINHDVFKFPVTFGFHTTSSTYEQGGNNTTMVVTTVGVGLNATLEFHPSGFVYWFFRVQGAYDFFANLKKTSGDDAATVNINKIGRTNMLYGAPSFGLGLSF